MIQHEPTAVGVCPVCDSAVPPSCVLIEYEAGGDARMYAECPDCEAVVDPTAGSAASPDVR